MILYSEVVAKNEKNAKMKMSQNLPKLAIICIYVIFEKTISKNAYIIACTVKLSFKTN